MVILDLQKRLRADGIGGRALVHVGARGRAVVEYRTEPPDSRQMGNYIVVEMTDGRITSMREYRSHRKARRVAGLA